MCSWARGEQDGKVSILRVPRFLPVGVWVAVGADYVRHGVSATYSKNIGRAVKKRVRRERITISDVPVRIYPSYGTV